MVVGGSVPDHIQFARSTGDAPGHDCCAGGSLVDLGWSRPCGSMVCGEAVVEVVIVAEDDLYVSGLVNADVYELVPIED